MHIQDTVRKFGQEQCLAQLNNKFKRELVEKDGCNLNVVRALYYDSFLNIKNHILSKVKSEQKSALIQNIYIFKILCNNILRDFLS